MHPEHYTMWWGGELKGQKYSGKMRIRNMLDGVNGNKVFEDRNLLPRIGGHRLWANGLES